VVEIVERSGRKSCIGTEAVCDCDNACGDISRDNDKCARTKPTTKCIDALVRAGIF
jgi:hypothetical protein